MSRKEYASCMQKQLLEEWFEGSQKEFLSEFVKACNVSKEIMEEVIEEME